MTRHVKHLSRDVARALRDLEELWQPLDKERPRTEGEAEAKITKGISETDYTPSPKDRAIEREIRRLARLDGANKKSRLKAWHKMKWLILSRSPELIRALERCRGLR